MPNALCDAVAHPEGESVGKTLPVGELCADTEGAAVREAVLQGREVALEPGESVELTVELLEALPVMPPLDEPEGLVDDACEGVGAPLGDAEPEGSELPVIEGEALGDAPPLTDGELLWRADAVGEEEAVAVPERAPDALPLAEKEGVTLPEGDGLGDIVAEGLVVATPEKDCPDEKDPEAVLHAEAEAEPDTLSLPLAEGVLRPVGLPLQLI